MLIRKYLKSDCESCARLFYETVHNVNTADYTKQQLEAWAPNIPDLQMWDKSFEKNYTLVAVSEGILVGFGDIDEKGYLDRLFVHKDYQKKGIATAICDRLEKAVDCDITTHASITAKPFFEKRGYVLVKEQQVERRGVLLKNYVMKKVRT